MLAKLAMLETLLELLRSMEGSLVGLLLSELPRELLRVHVPGLRDPDMASMSLSELVDALNMIGGRKLDVSTPPPDPWVASGVPSG